MSRIEQHCIDRAIAYHAEMGNFPDDEDECPYDYDGWEDDLSHGAVRFTRSGGATRRRIPCEMVSLWHEPEVEPNDRAIPPQPKLEQIIAKSRLVLPEPPSVSASIGHLMFPSLHMARSFIGIVVGQR